MLTCSNQEISNICCIREAHTRRFYFLLEEFLTAGRNFSEIVSVISFLMTVYEHLAKSKSET